MKMAFSDANVPLILACLAFLVICLLFAGILILLGRARERKEMIQKIRTTGEEWMYVEPDATDPQEPEKPAGPFMSILIGLGLKVKPSKSAATADLKTKLKFLRAGLRGENVVSVFWGAKILLATVLAMSFLIFAVVFWKSLNTLLLLYLVLQHAFVGMILPDVWLRVKTRKRKKRIERGLPDALDLLVVCVEAGMGLDAAIHRVGEEIGLNHPELSDELRLVNLELRAGKSRQSALRNLAERTGIDDVKSLVTLLVQTDRFGTSVAQALRVYSGSFRTTRYQRAEELAAKMATKLIFPLALFIFPSLFIVVLGPAAIQIFRVMVYK
jgi:tight adherence protein C